GDATASSGGRTDHRDTNARNRRGDTSSNAGATGTTRRIQDRSGSLPQRTVPDPTVAAVSDPAVASGTGGSVIGAWFIEHGGMTRKRTKISLHHASRKRCVRKPADRLAL